MASEALRIVVTRNLETFRWMYERLRGVAMFRLFPHFVSIRVTVGTGIRTDKRVPAGMGLGANAQATETERFKLLLIGGPTA